MRREKPATVRAAALLAMIAVAGCAVQPVQAPSNAPAIVDRDDAIEEFIELANRARLEAGCGTLEWNDDIAGVAQAHSADMQRRDYFEHTNPEGRTPMNRVQAAGIPVTGVAENIALGQQTGSQVFRSWSDSPGHRRNMLDCGYTHHGVGLAGAYWTHVLVRFR